MHYMSLFSQLIEILHDEYFLPMDFVANVPVFLHRWVEDDFIHGNYFRTKGTKAPV